MWSTGDSCRRGRRESPMNDDLQPTEIGRRLFAWCKQLFEEYTDAVVPVFDGSCPVHGQVVAFIHVYNWRNGLIRVAALHSNEAERGYQVYFDNDEEPRFLTVFDDGRSWGRYMDKEGSVALDDKLMQRLRVSTPVPYGIYGFVKDASVRAIIGFNTDKGKPVLFVYGLQGSALDPGLNGVVWEFRNMLAGGTVVPLDHVLAKGEVWNIKIPEHLLGDHTDADLCEGELPAIAWRGPAEGGLPEQALFVYTTSSTVRCPAVTLPKSALLELIGENIAPYILLDNEKKAVALALI